MNNYMFRKDFSIFKGTSRDLEIVFGLGKGCPYQMEENDKLILTVLDYRNNDEITRR